MASQQQTPIPVDKYKMLLIGETGSGKTSFLNLLCNYGLVKELGFEVGVEHFHSFNEIQIENAVANKMESKTSDAMKYAVSLGDTNLEIIDTPGFGDSRGMDEDKKHITRIINALKKEDYVNCVCLIINGRASRMSATLGYVLSEITSILPRTIIDNIIVVFTNTTGLLQLNFDLGTLKHYFGRELQHSFCIENPYCLFEKANERKGLMSRELLAESLKDEFERAAKTLNRLFTTMKSFKIVHTNDFLMLYKKKEKIEATITDALTEYKNQSNIENEITKTIKKIKNAIDEKEFHKEFTYRRTSSQRMQVNTDYYNTLCTERNCTSNCHVHCNLDMITDANQFKYCWCMGGGDRCRICGHEYYLHRHAYLLHKEWEETWWETDPEKERKFLDAKTNEERAVLLKKELQEKRDAIIQKKEKLFAILLEAIDEFQALGINRSFKKVLQNQIDIIKHYLEGQEIDPSNSGAEDLKKAQEKLLLKIQVVEEACTTK